ncbi:unnamed protein product [Diamesa hyperborea]
MQVCPATDNTFNVCKLNNLNALKGSAKREVSDSNEITAILVPVPTDGGYGWVITAMSFFMFFICEGITNSFGRLLLPITAEFGQSEAKVALSGALLDGFYFVCGAFASTLINIFGFRISGVIGTIIASTFMYLASTARSLLTLAIFHALVGVGTGIISCVASICIGYHFDKYRPFAYGIATSGSGAGTIAIFPILKLILGHNSNDQTQWREIMKSYSIILSFCLLLSLLAAKPNTVRIIQSNDQNSSTDDDSSDDDISTTSIKRLSFNSFVSRKSERISIFVAPQQPTIAEMLEQNRTKYQPKFKLHKKVSLRRRLIRMLKPTKSNTVESKPLSRDDIMYTQSTHEFIERRATEMNFEIIPSTITLHNQLLFLRMEKFDAQMKMWKKLKFRFCNSVKLIFDFSMVKSSTFRVLCVGSFFYAAGFFVPFMYLTDRAQEHGMPDYEAFWLISVVGVGNIFLRCFIGISVTLFPNINAIKITTYSLIISGVATIVTAFHPDHPFYLQAIYCICFSVGNACVMALRSIMYVNILGIERLTNAFGILSTMCGIGIMLGTPALGSLKFFTGNYCLTFVGSGLFLLIAAVSLRILPWVKKKEEHKLERNQFQLSQEK